MEPPGLEARCSFCGKEARKVRHLVASGLSVPAGKFGELPRSRDECRDLCLEILAETSPILSRARWGDRHHPGWQSGRA